MRKARVLVNGVEAGRLEEWEDGKYKFIYRADYQGAPVSLTMPIIKRDYEFNKFPPFLKDCCPKPSCWKHCCANTNSIKRITLGNC